MRLILGPQRTHLVEMTIDKIEIESGVVKIYWTIPTGSPYWCDPDTCVDTYEYNEGADSVTVTTAVQIKWADGGVQTLTIDGQADYAVP
jgi:hypothetical protein